MTFDQLITNSHLCLFLLYDGTARDLCCLVQIRLLLLATKVFPLLSGLLLRACDCLAKGGLSLWAGQARRQEGLLLILGRLLGDDGIAECVVTCGYRHEHRRAFCLTTRLSEERVHMLLQLIKEQGTAAARQANSVETTLWRVIVNLLLTSRLRCHLRRVFTSFGFDLILTFVGINRYGL